MPGLGVEPSVNRNLAPLLLLAIAGCGGGGGRNANPAPNTPITLARETLATGLDQPMQYVASTADPRIAYVLERAGTIRLLVDDALASSIVLDLTSVVSTDGEGGLQSMALAPDFASSRAFYLQYTVREGGLFLTRVSRFTMAADGRSASPVGAPVFRLEQPYDNHNGGTIRFRDGLLYIALGDGGAGNDPGDRAQNPQSLLGKVLRIDPTGDGLPNDPDNDYRIPSDNPFVGVAGTRGEIWAFGMRNPFRWSVDTKTGAFLYADVGQDAYEEIDYEPKGVGGRNYGWRVREGLHGTDLGGTPYGRAFTEPFLEYDHSTGRSITGGYVVREDTLGLSGRYLFADFVTNRLWSVPLTLSAGEAVRKGIDAAQEIPVAEDWNGIVAIEPDAKGRPVVVELIAGRVSRIVPKT